MITTKIWLYDSTKADYKGTEYTSHVLQADSNTDNLEDTLDTFEITLAGLTTRTEFAPKTKFIIEITDDYYNVEAEETLTTTERHDMEVSSDNVEQPIISDNNYFDHHLSLIECAVDAQNRLVDNIAVTYKLQDVTINATPTYDLGLKAKFNYTTPPTTTEKFRKEPTAFWNATKKYMIQGHKFEWLFPDWYNITIDGETMTPAEWWEENELLFYQAIPINEAFKTITFPVPMLKISSAVANSYSYRKNGFCSIDCVIVDTNLSTNEITETNYRINPNSAYEDETWQKDAFGGYFVPTGLGWIVSKYSADSYNKTRWKAKLSKVAEYGDMANRVISFSAYPNHTYSIKLFLHNFNLTSTRGSGFDDTESVGIVGGGVDNYPAYYSYGLTYMRFNWHNKNEVKTTNSDMPLASISFQGVQASSNRKTVFASAPPANAYNLFNKAQLCSQSFNKESGIIVDETSKPITLKPEDAQELKDTTIVECFYNQKNLWEILLDIGKYIHARPKLIFGDNNKYEIEWKRYGRTDKNNDNAYHISIYNSKFVEEYISAISSYVTNMVQLGGTIRERVAPKSSSEDYLVYNDVAEIKTSKNIIEIVSLDIVRISDGERRNLTGKDPNVSFIQINSSTGVVTSTGENNTTGFVFEKGVYNTLDVTPSTTINKGLAIYYELGTNVIKGLSYQLPTINAGDVWNDYAIKNIIGCAFNLTNYSQFRTIKVNDYYFDITYRTKDTLRTDQSRPDLRKYLLSSPCDKVPQHNQFANQTDTVIDSVKYGNNIYGSLIRTGNSVITHIEWVPNLEEIKHSGELYLINNQWYYVTKVKNTYYADHIISEVSYSQDFNKLSQIIGIPSEPRFYEISEQSSIKREVSVNDYIVIGTEAITRTASDKTYIQDKGITFIAGLLFSPINQDTSTAETEVPIEYPRYVVTTLKNDLDKIVAEGTELFNKVILLPISSYSLENTLTIEWDTVDNFSAGDKVSPAVTSLATNKAYYLLEPIRYSDKYGRADMFNFAVLDDYALTSSEIQNLPNSSIDISANPNKLLFGDQPYTFYDVGNTDTNKGIVLLKDNREHLCFNYNLQAITDSDRFVISAYMWQQGKKELRLGLLNEEVNKIANATIENRLFYIDDIEFDYTVNENDKTITVNIADALQNAEITAEQLTATSSIVIYSKVFINDSSLSSSKYFVLARNVSDLSNANKQLDWILSPYSASMFSKQ